MEIVAVLIFAIVSLAFPKTHYVVRSAADLISMTAICYTTI